jgi:hypothetical protein
MYRSQLLGWCEKKIKSTKDKIYIDRCLERHVARVRCRRIAEEMKTSVQRETVNRSRGGINREFMRVRSIARMQAPFSFIHNIDLFRAD